MEDFVPNRLAASLNSGETLLKAAVVMIAMSGPMVIGLMYPPCSHAQPQPAPAFEVASVKRADPSRRPGPPRTNSSGQQYTATNASLLTLIQNAYGARPWQFVGPDWLRNERFDILAKMPAGATKEQLNPMLQNLLAERFGLVARKQTRNVPIYELVVGKGGPKFKEAQLPAGTQPGQSISTRGLATDKDGWPVLPAEANGITTAGSGGMIRWMFRNQRLAELVNILQNHVGQTVIDKTGLTGTYDFDMTIIPTANSQPPAAEAGFLEAPSDPRLAIIDAVAGMGLKLIPTRGPVEVLVVDRVNKEPTEN